VADGRSRPSLPAAVVSTALHPLLLIPVTILLLTRDLRVSGLIAAVTFLPLLAITLRNVRRGTWSNFDVSDRVQRGGLYRAGVPLTLLGAAVLYLTGAPASMVRGALIAVAMMLSALVLSPFLKTSLHMLFASWSGILIIRTFPLAAPLVLLTLLVLGWSRLRLSRHTPAELIAGAVIGVAGGLMA
jgi:hypothetical protein